MANELKKLKIHELYSTLGYENDYPKRDAKILDNEIHAFFKEFALHNHISTAQVVNPGADLFARTFLEENDRGERFWPATHDEAPAYPMERDFILNALRQIFIRKKTSVECSKHAKKNPQTRSLTSQSAPSARKRKKSDIPSDDQPSPSKKNRSRQLPEPKPWKERPQEPDARSCIEYIRSLNPQGDLTDFSKEWLQARKAPWPEEADLRLQFLMHTHSFYISFDHGDPIPIGISQALKKDTQIEEMEAHQIKAYHNRISQRIHELTLKLIKEPPLVLRCRDDGVAVQTQKFSRMWKKKEEYWRADFVEFEGFGHDETIRSNKRRRKRAKPKEPVTFPKILAQHRESPMLRIDDLEGSALQFASTQTDGMTSHNAQQQNGFDSHLEHPPQPVMNYDEQAEVLNSGYSIVVNVISKQENQFNVSRRSKSPSLLTTLKEPTATDSGGLTPTNTPPATEMKADMDTVQGEPVFASIDERPGSSFESSIIIDGPDEEHHVMDGPSTKIIGACDVVMQNTPSDDSNIIPSNNNPKILSILHRSRTRNKGAFASDVVDENKSMRAVPEPRGILYPAEPRVMKPVTSDKQSAVNFPVDMAHSNVKAPQIPTLARSQILSKTPLSGLSSHYLHRGKRISSPNSHQASPSILSAKLSPASWSSAPPSKLNHHTTTPAQAGTLSQPTTASTMQIRASYQKLFEDFDKNTSRSESEKSSSPSCQDEQKLQEREQSARAELLRSWGPRDLNSGQSFRIQEHYQTQKTTWASDLQSLPGLREERTATLTSNPSLASDVARNERAKSSVTRCAAPSLTYSVGLMSLKSLAAPKQRAAMDGQSAVPNVASFMRGVDDSITNVRIMRDVNDFTAGARPSSLLIIQDPALHKSVAHAPEALDEIEKCISKYKPVQHQKKACSQSETGIPHSGLADTVTSAATQMEEPLSTPSIKAPISSNSTSNKTAVFEQALPCNNGEAIPSPACSTNIFLWGKEVRESLSSQKQASPTVRPSSLRVIESESTKTSAEASGLQDEALIASGSEQISNLSLLSPAGTSPPLHPVTKLIVSKSSEQPSRQPPVSEIESKPLYPFVGLEPRRSGLYNFVPEASSFSVKASAEDSPAIADAMPIPKILSSDRRIRRATRDPNVKMLYLILEDATGKLNVEDAYPFNTYVMEYTVAEFFDFYSEVSGVPISSLMTLEFGLTFGDNKEIQVNRNSSENGWKSMQKSVQTYFKKSQKDDPSEINFDIIVSKAN